MKKILPLNIEGFEFKDLDETAQNKVISDHINFWIDVRKYDEENKGNYERAIDDAEKNRTPWFTPSYILDYCREEIREDIENSDFLFDKCGNLIPIINYVDKDRKVINKSLEITKSLSVEISVEAI